VKLPPSAPSVPLLFGQVLSQRRAGGTEFKSLALEEMA
jgi:hypothetical protein